MTASAPGPSDYRLAPAVGARYVGALLVVLAAVFVVVTVVVAVAGLPILVLVVVAVVGLLVVLAGHLVLRRTPVVRLGTSGYRVRLIRGTGVTEAPWRDVAEAVTSTSDGVPVVVLRLVDGRATTIPVGALAGDREEFARDLRAHLRDGQGLRPLP